MVLHSSLSTDFLVIGSGIAGLSYALEVASSGKVLLITKKQAFESNTHYAQGGLASVWNSQDSFAEHIQDTLEAGSGLCHSDIVQIVVEEGPKRVRELIDRGVQFSKTDEENFDLGQEGGHSRRRVLHAGDATGKEIERALLKQAKAHSNIQILEDHIAIDLITSKKMGLTQRQQPTQVYGAYFLNRLNGEVLTVSCKVCLLATGGAGKVYLYTSNPDIATGDGIAMAYRAGAPVANLEFVQFHPTCLYHPQAKSFLISEALRGEGAVLRLQNGEEFMHRYHKLGSLAPRDVVSQAIDRELKQRGDDFVWLDITQQPKSFLESRFPNIYHRCLEYGFDLSTQPIPVVPAAHYFCGGVVVDSTGATPLKGLYACGEVSFTGLHGANRLASNSLLEAIVFAKRAADHSIKLLKQSRPLMKLPDWDSGDATNSDEAVIITHNWDEIRRTLWNYVGIMRTTKRLLRAQKRIALLKEEIKDYYWNFKLTADLIELRNLALVAELIVECALQRKESRGLHWILDYPHLSTSAQDTFLTSET